MTQFIGRERELADVNAEFSARRPSLVVVYGRRRIGKSTLLQHVAAECQSASVYFQATKLEEKMNLDAFKAEVVQALGQDPVLDGLSDWSSVLYWLARAAETRPGLIVILDEFPYISENEQALPSVIQKFWDSGAMKKGNMKLVLCGSLITQMEKLLAESNPLYGRRTMAFELGAMSLRDSAQFLPHYSTADKIVAYSVFGGIPYYLQTCDSSVSLKDNIVRNVMSQSGPLYDEPEFLLQSELRDTTRYSSIVGAIATGANKTAEIISRVGLNDVAQLTPYLDRLVRMRILEKQRPFAGSPKSRDTRYSIVDPIFKFWHRFVRPNMSAVARGFGEDVYNRKVLPFWSDYMELAFEDACREHLRLFAQERLSVPAQEIGKIWSGEYDLDVAGKLLDSSLVFGECKWETQELGEGVLAKLKRNAALATRNASDASCHFVLFSKKGFTPGLQKVAEIDAQVVLYDLNDLVDSPPVYDPTPHS